VPIKLSSDDPPGFYSFAWDKVTSGEKPSPQHALHRPEVYQPSSMIPQVSLRRQGLESGPAGRHCRRNGECENDDAGTSKH
jgi:hypothetical protein